MNNDDLKEYLGIVVDMEKSVYLQKNLLSNIEQELEELKAPKKIDDPPKPIPLTLPTRPKDPPRDKSIGIFGAILLGIIPSFLLGDFIMAIIMTALTIFLDSAQPWMQYIFYMPLWLPLIWVIICIKYHIAGERGYQEKRIAADAKYQEDVKNCQKQAQLEKERYQEAVEEAKRLRQQDEIERQIKSIFLQSQKKEVEDGLAASERNLQTIYEKNIIFPKYRNLVMACSLHECLSAGRCTELEGHEGAYNILELEIRMDRIILQLDRVIQKLEQIQLNQYELYTAVKEVNQRLARISGSMNAMSVKLDEFYSNSIQLNGQVAELNVQNAVLNAHIAELQRSSELAAYHTERAQKELSYLNRMNYLSGRNDDVFFNHPPV